MTQDLAVAKTGLLAREIARPEKPEFEICASLQALGDNFRCQLGELTTTHWRVTQMGPHGTRQSHEGVSSVFRLVAFGPTWEEAVSNYYAQLQAAA